MVNTVDIKKLCEEKNIRMIDFKYWQMRMEMAPHHNSCGEIQR